MVHGLWGATNTKAVVKFLKENKFNAVRLPFSVDMAYQPSYAPGLRSISDASAPPFQTLSGRRRREGTRRLG